MAARFISGSEVWPEITRLCKNSKRASVAVAYFTDKDRSLLSLGKGDRLVVNLSLRTLKTGATNPTPLLGLLDNGVRIYNSPTLHAKTFIFGKTVIVGSANVSDTSATKNLEACLITTDHEARASAKEFINSLCKEPLEVGPDFLRECLEDYEHPQGGSKGKTTGGSKPNPEFRLWFLPNFSYEWWTEADTASAAKAAKRAKNDISDSNRYETDECIENGHSKYVNKLKRNDLLLIVSEDEDGERFLCQPMRFLRWVEGKDEKEKPTKVLVTERRKGTPHVNFQDFYKRLPRSIKPLFKQGARTKEIKDPKAIDAVVGMWTPTGRLKKTAVSRPVKNTRRRS